jgi:hypothetical protein
MSTATLQNDTAATINATFTRRDRQLRVAFSSEIAPTEGFSLAELDVLQDAIAHARRHMRADETPIPNELFVQCLTMDLLRRETRDTRCPGGFPEWWYEKLEG